MQAFGEGDVVAFFCGAVGPLAEVGGGAGVVVPVEFDAVGVSAGGEVVGASVEGCEGDFVEEDGVGV